MLKFILSITLISAALQPSIFASNELKKGDQKVRTPSGREVSVSYSASPVAERTRWYSELKVEVPGRSSPVVLKWNGPSPKAFIVEDSNQRLWAAYPQIREGASVQFTPIGHRAKPHLFETAGEVHDILSLKGRTIIQDESQFDTIYLIDTSSGELLSESRLHERANFNSRIRVTPPSAAIQVFSHGGQNYLVVHDRKRATLGQAHRNRGYSTPDGLPLNARVQDGVFSVFKFNDLGKPVLSFSYVGTEVKNQIREYDTEGIVDVGGRPCIAVQRPNGHWDLVDVLTGQVRRNFELQPEPQAFIARAFKDGMNTIVELTDLRREVVLQRIDVGTTPKRMEKSGCPSKFGTVTDRRR